ncbi:unnamed protein product [Gordionus sp. m RMFG-2023]|uniref:mitochondrial ribonuclease P catalytic subunit-like n=1 Tax=Gordionus sp. m RMFG-2023 TaxID=3053472 RepID=UPI0030E29BCC
MEIQAKLEFNLPLLSYFLSWAGVTERWLHNFQYKTNNGSPFNSENSIKSACLFLVYPFNCRNNYPKSQNIHPSTIIALKKRIITDFITKTLEPNLQKFGPVFDSVTCHRALLSLSRCGFDDLREFKNTFYRCLKYAIMQQMTGGSPDLNISLISSFCFSNRDLCPKIGEMGWKFLKGHEENCETTGVIVGSFIKDILKEDMSLDLGKLINPAENTSKSDLGFQVIQEPLTIALLGPIKFYQKSDSLNIKFDSDIDRDYMKSRGMEALEFLAFDQPTYTSIYPSLEYTILLKEYLENLESGEWRGTFTSITNNGQCMNCKSFLKPLNISHEDFVGMRKKFYKVVINGQDIFQKTNPKELDRFLEFIKNHNYDVIIDALNLCMSQGYDSKASRIRILKNVIDYFTILKGLKVAIFGRKHMLNWDTRNDTFHSLFKKHPTFLTDNISKDDPFLIYAAMHAGMGTKILTKDMFRDHKYLLGNHSKTFDMWRKMHQLYLLKVKPNGQVNTLPTLKYSIKSQYDPKQNSWHIPYQSGIPLKVYEHMNTWLCLSNRIKTII